MLLEAPPYPLKGTTVFMCVCCTFRSSDFFTIRQKRICGGSTYAKCNSGQRDPAIVSLPRLARPGDTINSVQLLARQHTRCTLNYTAEAGRQAGREARKERGRIEDVREGGREQGESGDGPEQIDGVRKR